MTALEEALATLSAEVAAFKQGTPDQPPANTPQWFLLRARSAGLSLLKAMSAAEVGSDPRRAEEFFRAATRSIKVPE